MGDLIFSFKKIIQTKMEIKMIIGRFCLLLHFWLAYSPVFAQNDIQNADLEDPR